MQAEKSLEILKDILESQVSSIFTIKLVSYELTYKSEVRISIHVFLSHEGSQSMWPLETLHRAD